VPLTKNRSVLIPVAGGLIGLVAIGLLLVARRRRRRDEESAAEPVAAEPVGAGLR
jgi:LPXTG-motif cell wall-anchored protein